MEGAAVGRAAVEGGAGLLAIGIGVVALGVIAGAAVGAVAAGDGGGHHHPVADLQVAHVAAQGLDYADPLVTEDGALDHAAHRAPDEVQVGAADGRGRQADDGVCGFLQAGLGYLVETDIPHVMENHGFHLLLLVPPARPEGAIASAAGTRPLVFRLAGRGGVQGF
ncbi:hypothetical protein D3C85_1273130 [compost metagenome]